MRNLEKRPDNANVVTVYIGKYLMDKVDKLCEMSGENRSTVVRSMVEHCVPRAAMKPKTRYELCFD